MLDSIYHIPSKKTLNSHFWHEKKLRFCYYVHNVVKNFNSHFWREKKVKTLSFCTQRRYELHYKTLLNAIVYDVINYQTRRHILSIFLVYLNKFKIC